MRDFKKYDVWIISHEFVLKIYNLTEQIPENRFNELTEGINEIKRKLYNLSKKLKA